MPGARSSSWVPRRVAGSALCAPWDSHPDVCRTPPEEGSGAARCGAALKWPIHARRVAALWKPGGAGMSLCCVHASGAASVKLVTARPCSLRSLEEGVAGPSGCQGSAGGMEGADESSQNDHLAGGPVRAARMSGHPTRVRTLVRPTHCGAAWMR